MTEPDDDAGRYALKEPVSCILWTQPARINGAPLFACLEVFKDESHEIRKLLKCEECGQLYFYEFLEWIDWDEGDDPQYWTYIPVETAAEVEALKKTSAFELMQYTPRLLRDLPGGGRAPRLHWIR
jgi:hypothetical protein